MTKHAFRGSLFFVIVITTIGCSGGIGGNGGEFSIDNYPTLVNATPITFTGEKPSGSGVQVDGVERVEADSLGTWSVELDLIEGVNSFDFAPVDSSGQAGEGVPVTLTLDSTPPSVASRTPEVNAIGVSLNTTVRVIFSEPVDCSTVGPSVFSIVGVSSSLACTPGNPALTLSPDADLSPQTQYTVTLFSDVADPAGNRLAADENWQFTTGTDVVPFCGDGNQDAGEDCDDGLDNSDTTPDACRLDCSLPSCGDGVQDTGEECDDDNNVDGDGCSASCTTEIPPDCGDGDPDPGEECDDGANNSDTTPDACRLDCSLPSCGDDVQDTGEECDQGGNNSDTRPNACRTGCVLPFCGDGVKDSGEQCDDHNNVDGDGCAADCTSEGGVPPGSQLKIEFQLRDMWNYFGDEMYFRDLAHGIEINHFGVDIWAEGPWQPGESCTFNGSTRQREDTRYVGTISHGIYGVPCQTNPGDIPCSGWWNVTNYRGANYMAALIEFGQWASSTWPIPVDVQRRDPSTGEQWADGICANNQPCHPEIHYPWQATWGEWLTNTRMSQMPYVGYPPSIDGVTEPTVDSGQAPGAGPPLGSWTNDRTYTWDLTDHAGNTVQAGRYLINILLNHDRARKGSLHFGNLLQLDRETCWDDPADDVRGPHRAEGMIDLGDTPATIYLHEKAQEELVDACKWTDQPYPLQLIKCNCQADDTWPCPQEPISDPALIGQRILYMTPGKFVDPVGDGNDYAVKIQYCPGGPCP